MLEKGNTPNIAQDNNQNRVHIKSEDGSKEDTEDEQTRLSGLPFDSVLQPNDIIAE